jgi:N-acetylneuraminate synthase
LNIKKKIEFSEKEYDKINAYCKNIGIEWSASAWDSESLNFLEKYDLPFIKIPSDKNSDLPFINNLKEIKRPLILSSGGTSIDSLSIILEILKDREVALLQCTSIYPCPTDKINLSVMNVFKEKFKIPIGFSSHHSSPILSAMASAFGAQIVEVHVTLDRTLWGTDQAMSLGPRGGEVLIRSIKQFELAKGDSNKVVYDEESKTLSRTVNHEKN